MYRGALSVMLGVVSLLVAYVQFRSLPGQVDSLDVTPILREVLIVCRSIDEGELWPFPLDYLSQASTLSDVTIILLVAAKFAVHLVV
jgi:hypothetical protein